MRILVIFLAALFLGNAHAGNLPGILVGKLRLKMAAIDYQLLLNDLPGLLKDKDFRSKCEAALDAYGKDPLLAGAMNLSAVGSGKAIEAAAAGSGVLATIMHASAHHIKDMYPLFGPLWVVFTTNASEVYATKVQGEKAEYLLNTDKANGISMMATKQLADLASLHPEAESAIKDALVKKIQEKVKSVDFTAIDPYKLLVAVNAQNKKAVPDQALAPFAAAEKTPENFNKLSDQEMLRFVLAASAMLKTGANAGKLKAKSDAEKLAAELEYMAGQAATYRGTDKPAEPNATAP